MPRATLAQTMAGWRQRGISDKGGDGQRLQMSGQRQAQIRKRRRSSRDSQTPSRRRRHADGTSCLPLQLVQRLAPYEENRKHRQGSRITRGEVPLQVACWMLFRAADLQSQGVAPKWLLPALSHGYGQSLRMPYPGPPLAKPAATRRRAGSPA